jgi:hypothetical protein
MLRCVQAACLQSTQSDARSAWHAATNLARDPTVRAFAHSLKLSLYDRNSSLPTKGIKSTAVYLIVQRLVRLHTHEESCSFNYICEKTRTYIASLLTCGSMVEQCWCSKFFGKESFRTSCFLPHCGGGRKMWCSNRSWRRLTERGAAFFHERSRVNNC